MLNFHFGCLSSSVNQSQQYCSLLFLPTLKNKIMFSKLPITLLLLLNDVAQTPLHLANFKRETDGANKDNIYFAAFHKNCHAYHHSF